MNLDIKPFKKEYQDECKELILSGLAEHWGFLDETLNPDLNNIGESYRDDIFLTVWNDNRLIATVAARIKQNVAEIVRMSVLKDYRSNGIGKVLLDNITTEVSKRGINKLILETTTKWTYVVKFYLKNGFTVTGTSDIDTYFEKELI